jgi:hypothetical protein
VPGALLSQGSAIAARPLPWLAILAPYPLLLLTGSTPLAATALTLLMALAVSSAVWQGLATDESAATEQAILASVPGSAAAPG